MDDHLFDRVKDYGEYELIPRFRREFKKFGAVKKCPSYHEMLDFCKVLNILSKYTRYSGNWSPSDFLSDYYSDLDWNPSSDCDWF